MALPEFIAVGDFFKPPVSAAPSISPDGTKIAYLAPRNDRLNVWVQHLDSDADANSPTPHCCGEKRVPEPATRSGKHSKFTAPRHHRQPNSVQPQRFSPPHAAAPRPRSSAG